jgi:hypothetical protein
VKRLDDRPLLRATVNDMAVAPELAMLVALDAVLATAAFQLVAANPELTLEALARGDPPSPEARKATFLVMHIGELRTALRDYRNLALHGDPDDDRSF